MYVRVYLGYRRNNSRIRDFKPASIGRDGDLKPIPIAEKTAKNQKRMASVIRFSLERSFDGRNIF